MSGGICNRWSPYSYFWAAHVNKLRTHSSLPLSLPVRAGYIPRPPVHAWNHGWYWLFLPSVFLLIFLKLPLIIKWRSSWSNPLMLLFISCFLSILLSEKFLHLYYKSSIQFLNVFTHLISKSLILFLTYFILSYSCFINVISFTISWRIMLFKNFWSYSLLSAKSPFSSPFFKNVFWSWTVMLEAVISCLVRLGCPSVFKVRH